MKTFNFGEIKCVNVTTPFQLSTTKFDTLKFK